MSDPIERQEAIDALMAAVDDIGVLDKEDIKTVFDVLPSAEPKKGHWIYDVFDYVCSECGEIFSGELRFLTQIHRLPKFCPNCGAKMEGEKNESD